MQPWYAFNGSIGDAYGWSGASTGGWFNLSLPFYVKLTSVEFYGGNGTGNPKTLSVYASLSTSGTALASYQFANAANTWQTLSISSSNQVWTNKLCFSAPDCYGYYSSFKEIVLHGYKLVSGDVGVDLLHAWAAHAPSQYYMKY